MSVIRSASLAAAAALTTLFSATVLVTDRAWFWHGCWLAVVATAVGISIRSVSSRAGLVLPAQLVAVVVAATWAFAPGTTWWAVPTIATAQRFSEIFVQFGRTVYQASSSPLPAVHAVTVTLALVAVVVVIIVDHLAVTLAAPAVAGLPLLTVFLSAAANSSSALHPGYFAAAAVSWLVLLADGTHQRMHRWIDPAGSAGTERLGDTRFTVMAFRVGGSAVLGSLVLAALFNQLPTRYVLDGLAIGEPMGSSVPAQIGYNSTVDVGRNLVNRDPTVVFRYRTTSSVAAPFRVLATSTFDGTNWRAATRPQLGTAAMFTVSPEVGRTEQTVTVFDYSLAPPALATPQPIVAVDLGDIAWQVDESTRDVYAQSQPASYSARYVELDLTSDLLRSGVEPIIGSGTPELEPTDPALWVHPASVSAVTRALQEVESSARAPTDTPYGMAAAIQSWLRSEGGFTYSLELGDVDTTSGAPVDPITAFLENRRGYCVQFSSAMVMMARQAGIPARMAIGFLPGTRNDDSYTVTTSDAHAWPELYLAGAGWVRFEPTPSARTGAAPGWTVATPDSSSSPTTPAPSSDDRTEPPGEAPRPDPILGQPDVPQSLAQRITDWLAGPAGLVVVGLLLGILGSLVLPVTSRLVHRSRMARAGTPEQQVEVHWQAMTDRLEDLGVPPPPGGTLRDACTYYVQEGHLHGPARRSLEKLAATVERARYARPGAQVDPVRPHRTRMIISSVARTRRWRHRLRALLTPRDARNWWVEQTRSTVSRLGRPVRGLLTRVDRHTSKNRRPQRYRLRADDKDDQSR
ncbi:MAG: hypothetical protein CSA84_07060 [Actinomycetales bacterium]|nr:MAG: hypothetical protein CSA84_07060 [Actinomycetales bacterium]